MYTTDCQNQFIMSNNVPGTSGISGTNSNKTIQNDSEQNSNNRQLFDDNAFENLSRRLFSVAKKSCEEKNEESKTHRQILETFHSELTKLKKTFDKKS